MRALLAGVRMPIVKASCSNNTTARIAGPHPQFKDVSNASRALHNQQKLLEALRKIDLDAESGLDVRLAAQ